MNSIQGKELSQFEFTAMDYGILQSFFRRLIILRSSSFSKLVCGYRCCLDFHPLSANERRIPYSYRFQSDHEQ